MGNGVTFVAIAQNSDDSEFQDWTQKMHNSILAVGIPDVSASGAITDFGSLTRPAANGVAGYKIYSFDDALQATAPVFFKLEYGVGASNNRCGMYYTVGVTHDGSGSVTGSNPFTSREQIANSAQDPTIHQWFVGGDTNYLVLTSALRDLEGQLDGPGGFVFAIERGHDTAGADIANGIIIGGINGTNIYSWYSLVPSGSTPSKETEFPIVLGTSNPRTLQGRQIVSPVFPHPIINNNPALNILATADANFSDQDIIPIEFYPGITHNYVKVNLGTINSVANSISAVVLLRWT